jgi:hypothetical protein
LTTWRWYGYENSFVNVDRWCSPLVAVVILAVGFYKCNWPSSVWFIILRKGKWKTSS